MSFLKKIREKPEKEKKKILWVSVSLIVLFLIVIWILQLKITLKNLDFSNIPKPTINGGELNKMKENFKRLEENLQKLQPSSSPATTSVPTITSTPVITTPRP